MLDSIYHSTLKSFKNRIFDVKHQYFAHYVTLVNL